MSREEERRASALAVATLLLTSGTAIAQVPTWTQLTPTNKPSARWQQAMAYDANRGVVVLFGGRLQGSTYVNDTWEFDGENWHLRSPATVPTARYLGDMTYDAARGECLMFGGRLGNAPIETWTYDGNDWTLRQPTTSPPGRWLPAMTYDSTRQVVVMFGGMINGNQEANDTWEWDGTNWTQIFTANAPIPRYTNIAYDPARQRVVLFGGSQWGGPIYGDTWEYDGTDWTQIATANAPTARGANIMNYDAASQRIVVFGGYINGIGNAGDTWEYDGTNWTQVSPTVSPSPRRGPDQSVYDSSGGRILVFGGNINTPPGLSDQTWVYRSTDTGIFTELGTPCGATAVGLTATTPTVGQPFTVTANNLGSAPLAVLVHGLSIEAWGGTALPVDLGAIGLPGCELLTSIDFTQSATVASGSATFGLAMPANTALLNFRWHCQSAAIDFSSQPVQAVSGLGRIVVGL